jgi:SecD/SecF fusion protein
MVNVFNNYFGGGMAVDANVIVFARIREEIAGGKSVLAAVNEGYKKALSAILDGQVTTFIAALVLMVLGSIPDRQPGYPVP